MTRFGRVAPLLLLIGPLLWGAGGKATRLLLINSDHGHGHDEGAKALSDMLRSFPDIQVIEGSFDRDGPALLTKKNFDAMLFYDANQGPEPAGWMELLEKGMPTVFLHHTIGSYESIPATDQIFGGSVCWSFRWRPVPLPCPGKPDGTSLMNVRFRVKIADPDHPITKGMRDFEVVDETYQYVYVRPDVHVLLTTDEATSESRIGWTYRCKNSPIVYFQLGHNAETYANPAFRRLVERSIRWVGGKLDD